MKCPNCEETLLITERHGIEIDYCPKCRGVWLDKGELDKIIDKAEPSGSRDYENTRREDNYYPDNYDKGRHYEKGSPYRKKRGGFLGDLFDFD
ncbi:TFIIB-type zinc ribbon-containing protein [Flavitalea antarctica]